MIRILIRKTLYIIFMFAYVSAFGNKGDVSFFGALLVDPLQTEGLGFGGEGGFQIGANSRTDFQFSTNLSASPGYFDSTGGLNARYLITSYYTPYFGDIRPRLGGSMGLVQIFLPAGGNKVFFNAGANLQGLFTLNQDVQLYTEVNPNFTLGGGGDFSTLVKLGILFRLSK